MPRALSRHRLAALLGLGVAWACAAAAHHSFGTIYDGNRSVRLEGVVSEFLFVHPHPFLVINVKQDGGTTRQWRAELDNRFELADVGITAQTFRPGDHVIVSGSPGRKEPQILYLLKLQRPSDGLLYEQVDGTPTLHLTGGRK